MRILKPFILLSLVLSLGMFAQSPEAHAQSLAGEPQTVTLLARQKTDDTDNYTQAAFSFKHGINGDWSLTVTRNNWDILFGNSPLPDAFDVTMIVDDCSRIKDLGALNWSDLVEVPVLRAHAEPTREPSVKAIVGHMYLVHTSDRDNDHYALFRVEALESRKTVTISWKFVPSPE